MQVNFDSNLFRVPAYKVGEEVIFFSHVSGEFVKGFIGNISTYTDNNQNAINYTIMLDEQRGVPNIPQALVFSSFKEANDWIREVQEKLVKM